MPLVDLGPVPTKKKATGLIDLGPASTPITEALTAVEEPTEERPRFEAAPEPGIGQRIKDYFREPQMPVAYDLPEGRKYRTLPPTREEQPLRSLAELGAYGLGQYGVGRALYTPELITERPVERLTAPISAAEPTPKEKRIGESLKFIGGLRTAGQILGPVIATFPTASQQAIIGGAGVFGLRNITEQLANWARTGKTPSLEAFAKETALGALFGTAEVGLRGFVGFVKGLGNLKKGNVSWTNIKKPQDVADAIKHFQKTGDKSKWEAIRVKYAGITEKGAARIKARAEAIPSAEAKVKEFGKFPLARVGEAVRPPTELAAAPPVAKVPPEGIKAPPKPTEAKIPPKEAVKKSVQAIERDFWQGKVPYEQTLSALQQKHDQIQSDPKYKNPKGDFNIYTPLGRKKLDEIGWAITRTLAKKPVRPVAPVAEGKVEPISDEVIKSIEAGFKLKDGRIISTGHVHILPEGISENEIAEVGFIRTDTNQFMTRDETKKLTETGESTELIKLKELIETGKPIEGKPLFNLKGEIVGFAPPTPSAPAKEAWEMTIEEYFAKMKKEWPGRMPAVTFRYHKGYVKEALSKGKPVPREVLEEYKGEKWAQEALAKPTKAKGLTAKEQKEYKRLQDLKAVYSGTEKFGITEQKQLADLEALKEKPVARKIKTEQLYEEAREYPSAGNFSLIANRKYGISSKQAIEIWKKAQAAKTKPKLVDLGAAPKVEPIKEIKYEKEAITEPTPSPEVRPRVAEKVIPKDLKPTGKLDPTKPKEALELIKYHTKYIADHPSRIASGGIFDTKWDKERDAHVVASVEYTPEQIDTAYRNVQKPVPSPMPDTELFAMPGKEAQMQAIAQKMSKIKPIKRKEPKAVRLTKPGGLPKASPKKEDHIKAVYMIAQKGKEARPSLVGVKVDGKNLIATDGRRLFWIKGDFGKTGLYLDQESLKKGILGKPDKEGLKFPKWRDIVPDVSKEKPIVITDLPTVWRRVHQAALITTEESKGVTVVANKDGTLGFAASAPEVGHTEINVKPGGKILGGLNPQFLLDSLKFHAIRGDKKIKFYFPHYDRPALTKSFDGYSSTITMPINVGEPTEYLKERIGVTEPAPVAKPKGKPGFVDITPIVKAGKALVGDIEIEPSLEVESGAFNKHLNYFQGRQLPKGSQVRKIQKQMQVVNGQRLAGTITAKEANKKIQQLKKVLFETAEKEGIALRMTKGGKVSVAVRKAGTYVPVEFAEYKKFKDISPVFGGGQDITRAIQQMDGSLTVKQKLKEPGQAGQLEQNVLWPTRDMSLQKLEWQKEKAAELKGLLKVRKKSKGDKQINLVLEQIASQDRNVPIKKILSNKTLRSMASPDVIKQAIKLREFYDNLIDEQNIARKVRGQKEIAYRRNYSPHILRDATIWEQVMMMGKKAEDIFAAKADLPDYIRPNKPFNPREMARKGGIPYEKRVISARELAEIYLVTASQDIFNTSIIQNHKAFIQQLEAMGFGKSANYLADWTAEAYAGVKPRLDRVVGLPPKAQKSALWFNRLRNMAVFPLNFAWNTVVQPSSLALTIGRYGTPNTLQGFLQWLVPSVRRHTAKNYYSYVIKASKQGKITKQDARNLIGSDVKLKMTPGEMIENAGGFITNQIEKLLTGTSIRAAHIHGKKRGLKGEALRNYASDGGAKTQSMYNDEDKPALLRNLTVKTAAPYQTFAYEVVNTAREWYGRTGTPPDTKLYRLWTVLRFLAAATVFAMIGKKLANRDVWSWKRPPIPFAEFWLSPIIRTFSKEYVGGSASGLTSPVGTAQKVAKGIDDVLETGNWRKLRNELIKYGPGIFGIPGGVQMSRTVDAIISYSQGGVRDRRGKLIFKMEDPQDLAQGIYSGVWTTKGGREVIERRQGKKPVGARKARLERERGSTPKRGQEGTRKKRMEREKVMLRQ